MGIPAPAAPEAPASRLRRLFRNAGIYTAAEIALQAVAFLLAPVYTLCLDPAEFGVWGLGSAVLGVLALLFNPALHGAVTRFYFDHEHDAAARRRFQGTVQAFLLAWAASLALGLTLAGPEIVPRLFGDGLQYWPHGLLLTWTAFLGVLAVVPQAAWAASESAGRVALAAIGSTATYVLVVVVLLVGVGSGVEGLFWARLAAAAALAAPCVIFAVRHVGLAWDRPALRSALVFSLPLWPHLLAHWALALADRAIVSRFLGLAAVGVYASAYVVIDATNIVAAAANRAWVPQFTRYADQPSEAAYLARTVTWFVLAVSATCAGAAAFGPTAIRLAYDPRYHEAAALAPVLALGGFFQALYYLGVAPLFQRRRSASIPLVTGAAAAANVALNFWWVPWLGLAGAAWATAAGYLVLAAGAAWLGRRAGGLPFEGRAVWTVLACCASFAFACVAVDGLLAPGPELLAKLALALAALAALWGTSPWLRATLDVGAIARRRDEGGA